MEYGMSKILVIEDKDDVRQLISIYLKKAGYEVIGAVDGLEGVLKAQVDESIKLILLDIMMPNLNGVGVLEKLGDSGKMICMLTSLSDQNTVAECIDKGAKDYITKPIDRELLIAKVKSLLGDGKENFSVIKVKIPISFEVSMTIAGDQVGLIYEISETDIHFFAQIGFDLNGIVKFSSEEFNSFIFMQRNVDKKFHVRIIHKEKKGEFFQYVAQFVGISDLDIQNLRRQTMKGVNHR